MPGWSATVSRLPRSNGPTSERRPFTLSPFRGLRFAADTVGDLGTVISPPYDVLDADTVRDLEAANRRNIVRLILSRRFERPYLAVRARLHKWRDKGYLRADDDPALYLYEYTADDATVRGLIGLVGLRDEEERVVLPHEGVMAGPVDDRTVLMRTTETNLEPILLVHEGTEPLRTLIDDASKGQPVADFVALDGSTHRLWAVSQTEVAGRDRRRAGRHAGADRRRPPPLRRLPPAAGGAARPGSTPRARRPGTTGWRCSSTSATTPCRSARSTAPSPR